jgi:predicted ATPase
VFRSIDLANVRLFEGSGWHFDLQPLTVFCGSNSSGKSTILKSLLLLQQSISAQDATLKRKNQMKFVGELTDLGDFRSFVSHNDQTRDVSIAVSVDFEALSWEVRMLDSLQVKRSKKKLDKNFLFSAEFSFGVSAAPQEPKESTVSSAATPAVLKSAVYTLASRGFSVSWSLESELSPKAVARSYFAVLPRKLFALEFGPYRISEVEELKLAASGDVRVKCGVDAFSPQFLTLTVRPPDRRASAARKAATSEFRFPFPTLCTRAMQVLLAHLSRLDNLGPLRAPARRYYVTTLDSSPPLDPSGEFIAYTLREMSSMTVGTVLPKRTNVAKVSLAVALNAWLHYLRTGEVYDEDRNDEIKVNTTRNVLVECLLKSTNGREAHSLADSGFGYSQVLPMVLKLLTAPENSTTIIEQPELHLNPSLQVRVAEFLVAAMQSGRQILVETHSEHIVNTMRVLTAEESRRKLGGDILIYFIDSSAALPEVTSMNIQRDGSVSDWPPVFFGEAIALSSRLLRAQRPRLVKKARA